MILLKFGMWSAEVGGRVHSKIVLFHQGSTELQRCKNCVFVLPVNIEPDKCHSLCVSLKRDVELHRGVPIIGSAIISATNMAIFTNIGIGTEQQEDRYRYRYLYSSKSLYINKLCIGFLHYSGGSLVPVAYCSL